MKKATILAVFCLLSIGAFAQSPLDKGALQLNAGFGTSGWGTPIYVGLDYGIHEDITLGGEFSFRSYNQSYYNSAYGNYEYKSTIMGIGINGNYHFNRVMDIPSEWDFYVGPSLNFYIWNYDDNYPGTNDNSDIGLGAQIGGRYFFTDNFGLNLELGGGSATNGAKFGITYIF